MARLMWHVALLVTAFIVVAGGVGGGWETWALRYRPDLTITSLTKRYTHLAIIVALGLMVGTMLVGYALGVGGQ